MLSESQNKISHENSWEQRFIPKQHTVPSSKKGSQGAKLRFPKILDSLIPMVVEDLWILPNQAMNFMVVWRHLFTLNWVALNLTFPDICFCVTAKLSMTMLQIDQCLAPVILLFITEIASVVTSLCSLLPKHGKVICSSPFPHPLQQIIWEKKQRKEYAYFGRLVSD